MQTVRQGNFANGAMSIALDANDKVYLSAYDLNEGLVYATNRSGSWTSAILAADDGHSQGGQNDITVDTSANVHVVYSSLLGVHYASDETDSWVHETLWANIGGSCSIAADAGGNLHVAYDDNYNSDLRYAYKSAGAGWNDGIALADEWTNSDCDIAVDAANDAHIIFYFAGNYTLRYAYFDESWSVTTLEGSDTYPHEPETGWSPAIAVSAAGAPNIVFYNYTDQTVEYSDGTAHGSVVLKEVGGWVEPCIALDSGGYAHVFFNAYDSTAINYYTNRSGAWVASVLPLEMSGDGIGVVIDTDDRIHLVYPSKTYANLSHASKAI